MKKIFRSQRRCFQLSKAVPDVPILCKNDQFCHMLNIWYLRNETSYEDIRHGVRKLKIPSLWSEKFCQHLVNRCWLNLIIGQNEKNGQKLLKMDLKMSKNTVLGYKKGLKPQIFCQILKICTFSFPTHFRSCSYCV